VCEPESRLEMYFSLHVVDIQSLLENHSVSVCVRPSAGTCVPVIQIADLFNPPNVLKANKDFHFTSLDFYMIQ